jgi:hypothetical protein
VRGTRRHPRFFACEAFASNLENRDGDSFGNGDIARGEGDAGVLARACLVSPLMICQSNVSSSLCCCLASPS